MPRSGGFRIWSSWVSQSSCLESHGSLVQGPSPGNSPGGQAAPAQGFPGWPPQETLRSSSRPRSRGFQGMIFPRAQVRLISHRSSPTIDLQGPFHPIGGPLPEQDLRDSPPTSLDPAPTEGVSPAGGSRQSLSDPGTLNGREASSTSGSHPPPPGAFGEGPLPPLPATGCQGIRMEGRRRA